MTRGTFYLILPKGKVVSSCEFNGDMYGSPKDTKNLQETGHYSEAVRRLKDVKQEKTMIKENAFKASIKAFDLINFEYQKEKGNHFRFWKNKISEWTNEDGQIDMKRSTYFEWFFSDYLFWLNLSGKVVNFKDSEGNLVELKDGDIATFNFGEFIELIRVVPKI